MRVLHVTPSFYPASVYGGPIESLHGLCVTLVKNGIEAIALTTDANGPDKVLDVEKCKEVKLAGGLRVRYCKRLMPDSVSLTLLRLLPSYVRWSDLVHLTAVYSFPTIPVLLACRIFNKPLVWSPRGALQRWQGSTRVRVKSLWNCICQVIMPRKLVFHVTSDDEARDSQLLFPGIEPVVVANGTEIPEEVRHVGRNTELRLLYVGRIHPIKGIENLLEACKLTNNVLGLTCSVTIAGGGAPRYTRTIRTRIEELQLSPQVHMVGDVVGKAKEGLFENADIVVLPSYTESFGMVVAESLAHAVPVIASKGTPWRRVEEMRCGMWVKNDPQSLAHAIEAMSTMPLREMGQRGREWMQREFSWDIRANEMIQAYSKLLGKSEVQE